MVAFVVVEDEVFDPCERGFFGALGVVLGLKDVPHLVEQFFPRRGRSVRLACGFWSVYTCENSPDKPPGWQEQGYYHDFFPNKQPYKGFIRVVCQLQAIRMEDLRLTL